MHVEYIGANLNSSFKILKSAKLNISWYSLNIFDKYLYQ